jgi:acyl transferase domain-containing protein
LTKVLLQLKHRTLVPSLHAQALNPHIDFARTPFFVQQQLEPWEPPESCDARRPPKRIAGISSFGAGGANAHALLEELVR